MICGGGPRAPLFEDVAHAPAGGCACWLDLSDGVRIRVAHWAPKAENGTVLLFPGRTEYIEKYGLIAGELQERGFCTVVVDWRGQGIANRVHANPTMGHVQRFSDYQRDVAAVVEHAERLNLPKPYFLLAHSMGGCIGLRALAEGLPVQAAAFSAPMWGIAMSPALRPVAWGLSTAARPLGLAGNISPGQSDRPFVERVSFEENTLTTDPEMFAMMQEQLSAHPDLALGGPSLNWLNEALRECRRLAAVPSPDVPTVTFLGSDEAIVDPARIYARMSAWRGGRLEVLSGARHEVMMEGRQMRRHLMDRMTAHFLAYA